VTNPELRRVTFTYKMHRLQARSSDRMGTKCGPLLREGPGRRETH
jgi:hypothetical protein